MTKISKVGGLLGALLLCACGERGIESSLAGYRFGEEVHGLDAYGPIPKDLTRNVTCPGVENKSPEGGFNGKMYRYQASDEVDYGQDGWSGRVAANWDALSGLGLGNMEVVVIDIRRVGGKPHYLYLSNGRQNQMFEPWSASKFLAVLAAGHRARTESQGRVGLDSTVGAYDLGDMVTAIHTYKPHANVTQTDTVMLSNALASYFLNVAGREYATDFLQGKWLRVGDESQLRGGYGTTAFQTESSYWQPLSGAQQHRMGHISGSVGDKNMSALALSEALKRVTQFETDPATAPAPMTRADMDVLLYGNTKRPNEMGGMLAGESVYMAEALMGGRRVGRMEDFGGPENQAAKEFLDRKSNGQWRIFHKLGAGVSSSRRVAEIVMASYACLPGPNGGREFVMATMAHASTLKQADTMTTQAFNRIVPLLAPEFVKK